MHNLTRCFISVLSALVIPNPGPCMYYRSLLLYTRLKCSYISEALQRPDSKLGYYEVWHRKYVRRALPHDQVLEWLIYIIMCVPSQAPVLQSNNGPPLVGLVTIACHLVKEAKRSDLLGDSAEKRAVVHQWLEYRVSKLDNCAKEDIKTILKVVW